jgi:hypothetical protein
MKNAPLMAIWAKASNVQLYIKAPFSFLLWLCTGADGREHAPKNPHFYFPVRK